MLSKDLIIIKSAAWFECRDSDRQVIKFVTMKVITVNRKKPQKTISTILSPIAVPSPGLGGDLRLSVSAMGISVTSQIMTRVRVVLR